jgi:KN17 SH3-like C-terminal domain
VESIMEAGRAKAEAAAAAAAAAADAALAGVPQTGPWLRRGIVVKVLAGQLRNYFGEKGVVVSVVDGGYVGEVEMLKSGDVLRVDQAELQTVRRP